ncbi:MAG: hypothetical protein PHQ98_02250 [Candidatus ainarchaeum sp.]|nr:hypothetical protein [Candidatus ainarchaeum sp.]
MNKFLVVLFFCLVLTGLFFGCTEKTNENNNLNNNSAVNPVVDNSSNNNQSGNVSEQIPMPPALPE